MTFPPIFTQRVFLVFGPPLNTSALKQMILYVLSLHTCCADYIGLSAVCLCVVKPGFDSSSCQTEALNSLLSQECSSAFVSLPPSFACVICIFECEK